MLSGETSDGANSYKNGKKAVVKKSVSWFATTLLAWLGLAGLADSVVEWQIWFDHGVMRHWHSVKEWIIGVFFYWAPFDIPHWTIDYITVGGICSRAFASNVARLGIEKYRQEQVAPPSSQYQVSLKYVLYVLVLFLWPIAVLEMFISLIFGPFVGTDDSKAARHRANSSIVSQLAWSIMSFIPFLFVCSTLLYRFG